MLDCLGAELSDKSMKRKKSDHSQPRSYKKPPVVHFLEEAK
jgi:hypothetical protein